MTEKKRPEPVGEPGEAQGLENAAKSVEAQGPGHAVEAQKRRRASEPAETNALGAPLPRNWLATVAVIWCGQAASVFSTCAASFAAMWYITETTSSPLWLSLASAAALLPIALLSPFGGVAADRFRRTRVMILADGGAGAFSLVLAIAVFAGLASIPLMLALLAVRACAQAFHSPALTALMPSLVPERHLVRINSMDQTITSLSSIAGPALGILLYTTVGLGGVMVLDAACAAVACICLVAARVPEGAPSSAPSASPLADLREGAAVIAANRGLRNLMILVMVTMLLFMPAGSLTPLMTYQHFGGDGWQASLVEAVFGAGLLVGSAVIMVWGAGKRRMAVVIGSGIVLGIALACCGLLKPNQFPLFAALMGVAAAAIGCFNAPTLPLIQKNVPENTLGRVMGIFLAGSSLAAPAGLVVSGFVAEHIGITAWFVVCGLLTAACCAIAIGSKSLRKLE